jgi:DNA invertase Pin-like site-specific DNA recombinase
VQELAREITALYERGIMFISLRDNIDLSNPAGRFQFHVFCALAEFERAMISERTKEGLKHAKNVGKRGPDKKRRCRSGYYLRWGKKRVPANKTISNRSVV